MKHISPTDENIMINCCLKYLIHYTDEIKARDSAVLISLFPVLIRYIFLRSSSNDQLQYIKLLD